MQRPSSTESGNHAPASMSCHLRLWSRLRFRRERPRDRRTADELDEVPPFHVDHGLPPAEEAQSATDGPARLTSKANRFAVGSSSCRISNRFGVTSMFNWVAPVRLPPGRLRLAARPSCTGSLLVVKTMGMVVVAAFAVIAAGVLVAAITLT